MSKLTGKTALVTGGSTGIGLSIAKRFAAEGAHVIITGRTQSALDEASKIIAQDVYAVRGDVTDLADLDRLVAQLRSAGRSLDIVVANAGRHEQSTLADATPKHFDELFDVNVRGVFFTLQKTLPLIANGASIILVSSAVHAKGLPGMSVYSASKAAVRSLARSWAAELKDRGIRVNSLSPGAVDTALLTGQATPLEAEQLRQVYGTWTPLGRIAQPEEIATAALFLASSDSSFATGSDLVVDGGFTQL